MSVYSLQATWIRNSVLHALKKTTKINTREINTAFVYQHPTISSLGRFVGDVTTKGVAAVQGSKEDAMLNMAAKYSKNFSAHKGSVPAPTEDVILITGSTGAIGSNVLAELAKSSKVAKVYAVNRKLAMSSIERQKEALKSRGLDPALIDGSRVVVVDGDLTKPDLGLTPEMFDEVGDIYLSFCLFVDKLPRFGPPSPI